MSTDLPFTDTFEVDPSFGLCWLQLLFSVVPSWPNLFTYSFGLVVQVWCSGISIWVVSHLPMDSHIVVLSSVDSSWPNIGLSLHWCIFQDKCLFLFISPTFLSKTILTNLCFLCRSLPMDFGRNHLPQQFFPEWILLPQKLSTDTLH